MQHGVGVRVFLGDILHGEGLAFFFADQLQRLADGGEHAQGQHIHFHQAQAFQIVFVPLNHGAAFHGGIFYRHQLGQWPGTDDKTADMLGQVAGKAQ